MFSVASFTDAWIETLGMYKRTYYSRSHLLQMRGLKLMHLRLLLKWLMSHLLQMRGLKHEIINIKRGNLTSHLLQMRGLKHIIIRLLLCLV